MLDLLSLIAQAESVRPAGVPDSSLPLVRGASLKIRNQRTFIQVGPALVRLGHVFPHAPSVQDTISECSSIVRGSTRGALRLQSYRYGLSDRRHTAHSSTPRQ